MVAQRSGSAGVLPVSRR